MNKKYFQFTHYDLDGVVCHIILKTLFKKIKSYQCGYNESKKKATIERLISNAESFYESSVVKKLFITDFSLTKSELSKMIIYFDKVFLLDHHEDSKDLFLEGFYERCGNKLKAVIDVEKSGSLLVYKMCQLKLENKLSRNSNLLESLKKLVVLANDHDLWIHKYYSSWGLDKIFWHYGWGGFVSRFSSGFSEFRDNERIFIKSMKDRQLLKIKEQKQINMDDEVLIVITNPGVRDSITGDLTLFQKGFKYYFVYQPDACKVSVRAAKETNTNLSRAMNSVFSEDEFKKYVENFGGHKLAGAFMIHANANKPNIVRHLIAGLYEEANK